VASKCDELRSKIVATKEGGAITGEERIRELLGQLYGSVNNYEGRPTNTRPLAPTPWVMNWKTSSVTSKS